MSKQESAQGTIEDKLNNILEDFCSEHNDEWLNITVKQLQDFITTETTKAVRAELINVQRELNKAEIAGQVKWYVEDRLAALRKEQK